MAWFSLNPERAIKKASAHKELQKQLKETFKSLPDKSQSLLAVADDDWNGTRRQPWVIKLNDKNYNWVVNKSPIWSSENKNPKAFKDSKKLFNSTKRSIEITYNLCEIYNCKLTIVFIPNSDILPDYRSKHYAELIENFTNLLNINFINGTQILNTTNGSLDYAIKGHHLSPIGYKKLTELMYKN